MTGMPWSCAAGTKWVPIRPLVEAPQIAKVPASSQKSRCARPWTGPSGLRRAAPLVAGSGGT